LWIQPKEFEAILRAPMEHKHEQIKLAMSRFEYFKNFTEEKIIESAVLSKIEEFEPQTTIYSQNDVVSFSDLLFSLNCC